MEMLFIYSNPAPEEPPSRLTMCKNALRNFVVDSTFHGLPYIELSPQMVMKVGWFILVTTAVTFCFIHMSYLIEEYITYPTHIVTAVSVIIN